jgi:hypothetical protein
LQSGVLAGAGTRIGFLPSDDPDWAGWVDLSTFSDAHPMYGDLLLCIDRGTETYTLFAVSEGGLDPLSTFDAEELADPVAGWCAPTNPDRVLLLGEGGLWSLNPPYTAADRQHLVSFDDVDLPPFEDIPSPFQPGPATVVVPRRRRTGLRLDLSDGSGHATGLAHLPGGAALWTAYLRDDRATAARLLSALAQLPAPPRAETVRLHDVLMREDRVEALATSTGVYAVPDDSHPLADPSALRDAPLDTAPLATWRLWLDGDEALTSACRLLWTAPDPDPALIESLRVFAGEEAVHTLFDVLRASAPPVGPEATADRAARLRALVAPLGGDAAAPTKAALTDAAPPVRVAGCVAAGAVRSDATPEQDAPEEAAEPALWSADRPPPAEALLRNTRHNHPAVRAAARDACARLSIETSSPSGPPSAPGALS